MSFSISSGASSELNGTNLDVRLPESSSLVQPYLVASRRRGCGKKAFHHMELSDVYHRQCFHWKSHWLEAVTLAFGDLPVFARDFTIHLPLTRFMNHCAWWLCLEIVCLYRTVWSPAHRISMWYLCQLQSRLPLYYSRSYYEEPTGLEYM